MEENSESAESVESLTKSSLLQKTGLEHQWFLFNKDEDQALQDSHNLHSQYQLKVVSSTYSSTAGTHFW